MKTKRAECDRHGKETVCALRARAEKAEAELTKLKSDFDLQAKKMLDPEYMDKITANDVVVEAVRRMKVAEAANKDMEIKLSQAQANASECCGEEMEKKVRNLEAKLEEAINELIRLHDVVCADDGISIEQVVARLGQPSPATHCGHPPSSVSTGDEGTSHCAECEREAKVEKEVR